MAERDTESPFSDCIRLCVLFYNMHIFLHNSFLFLGAEFSSNSPFPFMPANFLSTQWWLTEAAPLTIFSEHTHNKLHEVFMVLKIG